MEGAGGFVTHTALQCRPGSYESEEGVGEGEDAACMMSEWDDEHGDTGDDGVHVRVLAMSDDYDLGEEGDGGGIPLRTDHPYQHPGHPHQHPASPYPPPEGPGLVHLGGPGHEPLPMGGMQWHTGGAEAGLGGGWRGKHEGPWPLQGTLAQEHEGPWPLQGMLAQESYPGSEENSEEGEGCCKVRTCMRVAGSRWQGRQSWTLFLVLVTYARMCVSMPTLPDLAQPYLTLPNPTRPDPTRPDLTRPDPTRPDPTRPDPTRPDPTRPDPTRPDLTLPHPHCLMGAGRV